MYGWFELTDGTVSQAMSRRARMVVKIAPASDSPGGGALEEFRAIAVAVPADEAGIGQLLDVVDLLAETRELPDR